MGRPYDPARATRERLRTLERQEKGRVQAREVAEGVAETVRLERARGAAFDQDSAAKGARETPYRRMTGLEWLARKGRLTPRQQAAGDRYGEAWRRAREVATMGSTLEVQPGGNLPGAPALGMILRQAAGRCQAEGRLLLYRGRLMAQQDLISACDQICGQELTPREAAGGDRDAARLEAVLKVALDILATAEEA